MQDILFFLRFLDLIAFGDKIYQYIYSGMKIIMQEKPRIQRGLLYFAKRNETKRNEKGGHSKYQKHVNEKNINYEYKLINRIQTNIRGPYAPSQTPKMYFYDAINIFFLYNFFLKKRPKIAF